MIHFHKTLICLLLISLSFVAYGEKIVPPVSVAELPTDLKDKSPEELADLMSHIAGWSYQVLLDVPKQGLKDQQESLEQIIVLRKWLQARQHPLFQLLAFHLIIGVDRAILNEIFRQEMAKHGITIGFPVFKTNSFDKLLLKRLLMLNDILETELIKYAISLDGKIATICRQQNYPIEDYTSGMVLKKFSEEMNDYTDNLMHAPLFFAKFSKPLMADLLFTQTLKLIDEKRDTRLLTDIYFESGFPSNGKDLENIIKLKLPNQRIQLRLSTGYKITSNEVMDTLLTYVESKPSRPYGLGMTILLFLPFLNDLDVIPTQYLNQLPDQGKLCFGQWLTFSEDVNLDEEKMTREDKYLVRECPMINNLEG